MTTLSDKMWRFQTKGPHDTGWYVVEFPKKKGETEAEAAVALNRLLIDLTVEEAAEIGYINIANTPRKYNV